MRPIDFDEHFTAYAEEWMHKELAKGRKPEELEDELSDLYLRFLNTKADWLEGATPATYFDRVGNAEELIALLREYEATGISVPDPLMDTITSMGAKAIEPLLALAADADAPEQLRVTALNLLLEQETDKPLSLCVDLIRESEKGDALAEAAADLLRSLGKSACPAMLTALSCASDAGAEIFLDLLSNFPGLANVYEETVQRFLRDSERRAIYASFLARLGDERAIEPLTRVSEFSDLNYLDYIEIRDAVEALGGTLPNERDFNGDPYFESMRML